MDTTDFLRKNGINVVLVGESPEVETCFLSQLQTFREDVENFAKNEVHAQYSQKDWDLSEALYVAQERISVLEDAARLSLEMMADYYEQEPLNSIADVLNEALSTT